MVQIRQYLGSLHTLTWTHLLAIAAILAGVALMIRVVLPLAYHAAEQAPSKQRLRILRTLPFARMVVWIVAIAAIIPILIEPTVDDVLGLIAWLAIVLAFALRDYVTSVIAGIVTVLEKTYQPGDWVELNGVYGEVRMIGIRAVRIVTPDDSEAIIPNSVILTSRVVNASEGREGLLCVTNFYLDPDHDGAAVQAALKEIGETSSYREWETPVRVTAREMPWATHYKLLVCAHDGRKQFVMITDLTIRAKERLRAMEINFAHWGSGPWAPQDNLGTQS